MLRKLAPIILILLLVPCLWADEAELILESKIAMGPVTSVSASGNIIYAGITSNVNVYDIYNEAVPQLMYSINGHNSMIRQIETQGDKLYVIWEGEGLFIFDISSPYRPSEIGSFTEKTNIIKSFTAMSIDGDLVYLAGKDYFTILDCSTPATPLVLSLFKLPVPPTAIDQEDGKLWVTTAKNGMAVYQVTNPRTPKLIGYQKGHYTSIDAYEGMIFYGRTNKKEAGEKTILPNVFTIPFRAPECVQAHENYLFVGGLANWSIYTWNRKERTPKMLYNQSNTPTFDFLYRDDIIYLANSFKGLNVYDVTKMDSPSLIGSVQTHDRPNRLCFIGDTVYIAANQSHIVRYDITNTKFPWELEPIVVPGLARVWSVVNSNDKLFVMGPKYSSRNYIYMVIIDPVSKEVLVDYEIPYSHDLTDISTMHIHDNICAVNLGKGGIEILDISDIKNIQSLSHIYKGGAEFFDIEFYNDLIFTSDYRGGYHIYDMTNPKLPERISTIQTSNSGGNGIEIVWPYLIASDGDSGVVVISIAKPDNPSVVKRIPSRWGTDIAVDENYIYMSDGTGQLKLYDISNLPEIQQVAELPESGYWTHVYLKDGFIYGIDIHHGVYIYRVERGPEAIAKSRIKPGNITLYENYPNPFNAQTMISFYLENETKVNLSIYNLLGQKVETLIDNTLPAGEVDLRWDAKDHPSGVYFYVLKTPGKEIRKQMEMVK
ncbi:T9SS type A sorting domain-containing protein [bacterium]|nr:T9SS type A sorting domain-containing protein [bacterium]